MRLDKLPLTVDSTYVPTGMGPPQSPRMPEAAPQVWPTSGWLQSITLQQLANHTAGFDKPGGLVSLLYRPGTTWSYSDGGANWLADVLTVTFATDLNSVMFDRVFSRLGIGPAALVWRRNAYRDTTINAIERREFGSGISASVDAMARIGYLYLRDGLWHGHPYPAAEFCRRGPPTGDFRGRPPGIRPGEFSSCKRALWFALVEQRRWDTGKRTARHLLVLGSWRQPDRGHSESGHCCRARWRQRLAQQMER